MYSEHAGQTASPPGELGDLLESVLDEGEQVLWFAQPDARRRRRRAWSAVPVGFAIMALIWKTAPWTHGGWHWLIALLCPAALILVCLPWHAHVRARGTLYAITGRRALILSPDRTTPVRSYPVQQLPALEMRARKDGTGDLILEIAPYTDSDGYPQVREHGFEDIAEVSLVRYILENLAQGKDPGLVRRHAPFWRQA